MRLNLPVSDIEFTLPDGVVIVSKTDPKGVITYCNRAFVEISGRSREEIIGSPHNIVRHPDMPPQVFADLWKTIKANKPWQGVVKNRRKDGSFYWAVSNVTPLQQHGETVGYVAFRYKATQQQIDYASAAYREIREGSHGLHIKEGRIVRANNLLLYWIGATSIRIRLLAFMAILLGALVVIGIYNLREAAKAHDHAVEGLAASSTQAYALDTARIAESAFKDQLHTWSHMLIESRDTASFRQYLEKFDRQGDEVEQRLAGLLKPIMQQIGMPTDPVDALLENHAKLINQYHSALKSFDIRKPETIWIVQSLTGDTAHEITENFDEVVAEIRREQLRGLGSTNEELEKSYRSQNHRAIETLVAVALGGLLLSIGFIVSILRPVRRVSGELDRVAQLQQQFLEKILVLEEYHDRIDEEQRVGSHIMARITNAHGMLDPFMRYIVRPAEHFSGDMLITARTPDDVLHILLADAVGHGLIAAVNVLPLSQAFYTMTEKGFRIPYIAGELNLKINKFMPVDRFVATTLIAIDARNRVIEVWNGGNPALLLVNNGGEILRRWIPNNLPLGILTGESFSGKTEVFQYEENCQLFFFSDGLPEAEDPLGEPFGEDRIHKALRQSVPRDRFGALIAELDSHLAGRAAHDDISLAMIEISTQHADTVPLNRAPVHVLQEGGSNWKIEISLGAAELKYLNAVPMLTAIIENIHVAKEYAAPLFMIMAELFNNALDHGILRLDSSIKLGYEGFDKFLQLREERLHALDDGKIDLEIESVVIEEKYGVKIRVIDSGNGFDYMAAQSAAAERAERNQHGRGIMLVKDLAFKLEYAGNGNEVTVYYICA